MRVKEPCPHMVERGGPGDGLGTEQDLMGSEDYLVVNMCVCVCVCVCESICQSCVRVS